MRLVVRDRLLSAVLKLLEVSKVAIDQVPPNQVPHAFFYSNTVTRTYSDFFLFAEIWKVSGC